MEKEPKEVAIEYAGFWIRLGAWLLDGIILLFMAWLIPHLFATLSWSVAGVNRFSVNPVFSHSFVSAQIIWVIACLKIPYFVGFWVWRGQTPGNMALGIKVIRTSGASLTLSYALLRYLGCIVSSLIVFIGFIWIAFDSRKQGIHDKIADTYVIKLPVRQPVLSQTYA